jgi:hypothetical protein
VRSIAVKTLSIQRFCQKRSWRGARFVGGLS